MLPLSGVRATPERSGGATRAFLSLLVRLLIHPPCLDLVLEIGQRDRYLLWLVFAWGVDDLDLSTSLVCPGREGVCEA